jgi:phospholipid/cholesterol/gamma-HCH transport system permease protein
VIGPLAEVGHWAVFACRSLPPTATISLRPAFWLRPVAAVVLGALPLVAVLGLALGAVIWMQTRGILERTAGATDLLPTVLAAAVLLELAPVGAGLIVATRTGASIGAELAAMRASEQLDALEILGVSPRRWLVAPRVFACVVSVPILHVLTAALALGSGFVAELLTGETTWRKYETAVLSELRLGNVLPAAAKTLVFGWLVGVSSCYVGLTARIGAEGVGRAATTSVVICTLLVLAADVFLVAVTQLF